MAKYVKILAVDLLNIRGGICFAKPGDKLLSGYTGTGKPVGQYISAQNLFKGIIHGFN
ncbi:hypothetical protein ASZ90_019331 [hydrocarbon metagenome]|uniref:Uncharacterized protein n=1 Tax=hydrocarbon metagenome TaxID=938273 RepID=A0A0W8E3L1_9ZZZZ